MGFRPYKSGASVVDHVNKIADVCLLIWGKKSFISLCNQVFVFIGSCDQIVLAELLSASENGIIPDTSWQIILSSRVQERTNWVSLKGKQKVYFRTVSVICVLMLCSVNW